MLTQKLSPPAGKVSRRSRDERGTTQSRQVKRDVPPSASPTLSSSPINGGAFWCGTSSNIKPALTGRWPRAKRADGGVASALLLFTATPQSIRLTAYCQLPGRGAFWCSLQPHPFTRLWRISHGEAIFHCASAQFHPAQAGFHCGRKSALL